MQSDRKACWSGADLRSQGKARRRELREEQKKGKEDFRKSSMQNVSVKRDDITAFDQPLTVNQSIV